LTVKTPNSAVTKQNIQMYEICILSLLIKQSCFCLMPDLFGGIQFIFELVLKFKTGQQIAIQKIQP